MRDRQQSGFTLLELMLATVLASIVMMAVGGLIAGFWRTSLDFIGQEQTMQEISQLSRLFAGHSRALPSALSADLSVDGVEFPGAVTPAILYDASDQAVLYDLDTGTTGDEGALLSRSVVDDVFTVISTGGLVQLEVKIREDELGKTNTYRMYAAPRNE
jgi:prepilin-type N-terminal cleavage/methylation domain-containing protein